MIRALVKERPVLARSLHDPLHLGLGDVGGAADAAPDHLEILVPDAANAVLLLEFDGPGGAGVGAGTTADAHVLTYTAYYTLGGIDHVGLLALSRDAVLRAVLGAEAATGTCLRVYVIGYQRLTYTGRALLVPDVGLVFLAEVIDGGEHRVGGRGPQAAERPPRSAGRTAPPAWPGAPR